MNWLLNWLTAGSSADHRLPNNVFEHRNMQRRFEFAADRTPFLPANIGFQDLQPRDLDPHRLVRGAIGQQRNPKPLLGNILHPDHHPWPRQSLPNFANQRDFSSG